MALHAQLGEPAGHIGRTVIARPLFNRSGGIRDIRGTHPGRNRTLLHGGFLIAGCASLARRRRGSGGRDLPRCLTKL